MNGTDEKRTAGFYSPFSFLAAPEVLGGELIDALQQDVASGVAREIRVGDASAIYRHLSWDSDFFGVPTYRVDYVSNGGAGAGSVRALAFALQEEVHGKHEEFYLFGEIPSEDVAALGGLTAGGWRLIETRITCFRDDVASFELPRRAGVRRATQDDVAELRAAASSAVNVFDRFHADDFFTPVEADEFLAVFVENSVKGFADEVLVPAEGRANAFLTANYVKSPACLADKQLAKMVLSAVTPERRGWYVKLIGEMSQLFKEKGIDAAFMTTQSTNRAVLKVWHKHGYRFGRCTHLLSTFSRKGR